MPLDNVFNFSPNADLDPCPNAAETIIETRNLTLYYHGKPALQDISLRFHKNEVTAIIGPSGCGKSSLLKAINRLSDLIPGCRVDGEVRFNGQNIFDLRSDLMTLRRNVGMVFQKPNPFAMSILRNIDLPLKEHGVKDKDERRVIIESVLQQVGLWDEVRDRLHDSALMLSGGQQQRLCIARTLALSPSVLLMDEPCSALDPISSAVVEDLIKSLATQYTVILVTHNLAQARRISDRVALFWVLDNVGCMIEYARSEKFFNSPKHPLSAAYIEGRRG